MTSPSDGRGIARRTLLALAGGAGVLAPGGVQARQAVAEVTADEDAIRASTDHAVVTTASGRLRGYSRRGTFIFKGVPYAGDPGKAGRFRRAPPCPGWTGVRNALNYGPICPHQTSTADTSDNEWVFMLPQGQPSAQSEDCLRLNVWTPGLDAAKRPVMVWLHAHGFGAGSSQEFLANDGENLSRSQDVVVVNLNHRVGVIGFLHLEDIDPAGHRDSANVGMLDVVDGLRWVRENIASFGGDPGNVTVFGQSGGGFKASVLLAMPEAEGLFHKAIIQSGARPRVNSREAGTALASQLLAALGLPRTPEGVRSLQEVSTEALLTASASAAGQVQRKAGSPPEFSLPSWYWQPVAGVDSLPAQPFDPEAPATSRSVPLIVGTVLNEVVFSVNTPEAEAMSWDDVASKLRPALGDKTQGALAILRRDRPGISPIDALSIIESRHFRLAADAVCLRKSEQGGAQVFNYLFCWKTSLFDGRPRAFHTSDVPFVFANTDLVDHLTGGGARARVLGDRLSAAWAAFARHGVPAAPGLPAWTPYTPGLRRTMVLDDHCAEALRPDGRLLDLLSA